MTDSFRVKHTFQTRSAEATRVLKKYPDRIPVVVERDARGSSDIPDIDKKKFLVPKDLSMGQFSYVIRKRIKLKPEQAIFLFVNNKLPPTSSSLSEVFHENKEECGFLYITYSGESTFG